MKLLHFCTTATSFLLIVILSNQHHSSHAQQNDRQNLHSQDKDPTRRTLDDPNNPGADSSRTQLPSFPYDSETSSDFDNINKKKKNPREPTEASTTGASIELPDSPERRKLVEGIKKVLLNTLGVNKPPSTNREQPLIKAFVPPAILEEYIKVREEVRSIVPNDADFYGKLTLDDLHRGHHGYTAEILMGNSDVYEAFGPEGRNAKSGYDGKYSKLESILSIGEAQDIAQRFEAHLMPRAIKEELGQYHSTLLKINLTQTALSSVPSSIVGADLQLAREKLLNCDSTGCKMFRPTEQFAVNPSGGPTTTNLDQDDDDIGVPRYQRIYILKFNGFDQSGDMISTLVMQHKIDNTQATPIIFDIKDIIKDWIKEPDTNHGIIVRIKNEDPEYEARRISKLKNKSAKSSDIPTMTVFDHIRLKRAYAEQSDNEQVWEMKRPRLTIFYDTGITPEVTRHHVKRDNSAEQPQISTEPGTVGAARAQGTGRPTSDRSTRSSTPSNTRGSTSQKPASARTKQTKLNSNNDKSPKAKSYHKNEQCAKRTLHIDFDEVGWTNWIIAPRKFAANFCSGECAYPMDDNHNATNHAIIQSIFNSVGRLVPKSCCAPTKFSKLALLFQLDGVVQMKYYNDMVVDACGCL